MEKYNTKYIYSLHGYMYQFLFSYRVARSVNVKIQTRVK